MGTGAGLPKSDFFSFFTGFSFFFACGSSGLIVVFSMSLITIAYLLDLETGLGLRFLLSLVGFFITGFGSTFVFTIEFIGVNNFSGSGFAILGGAFGGSFAFSTENYAKRDDN